jgi:hypothetical protein
VEGKPASSAVDKYRREIKDSCLALWKIWVPAQLINFAFVPRHLRIPYVAAVSFGWTVVLSTMQGRYAKQEAEAQAAASASADEYGRASQELMANIVATGGVPSPSSSAPKKGGGDAAVPASLSAVAAASSHQRLGGLKDIAAERGGVRGSGIKKESGSRASPAIVAASRAEAAALVASCAAGTGGGGAAAA